MTTKIYSTSKKIYSSGLDIYNIDHPSLFRINNSSDTKYGDAIDKTNQLRISDEYKMKIFKRSDKYCIFKLLSSSKTRREDIKTWLNTSFVSSKFFDTCVLLINQLSLYYDYIVTDILSDDFNSNIIQLQKFNDLKESNLNILFISEFESSQLLKNLYNNLKLHYNCLELSLFEV